MYGVIAMTNLNESAIESLAMQELAREGYIPINGADIAPGSDNEQRQSFEETLLKAPLQKALSRINPHLSQSDIEEAIAIIKRINSSDLITNNEEFHRYLTEGIPLSKQEDGESRGDLVKCIDFDTIENNEFLVVNQFTVKENDLAKRPDLVIFINGLPLIIIELKNAIDEKTTIKTAFKQIQTYKDAIPSLFTTNAFIVISDGLEAKAGSLSANFERYMAWKTSDGKTEAPQFVGQLETLIKGMLKKHTVIDLIRHFIVFEKTKKEDPNTKQITIKTIKKLASYHQYYAVNKAVKSTLEAASENGNRKGGVIWHTQGSGKSLSMVFYTGKIVLNLDNPTVVVITDRNDLDDQLFDTFSDCKQALRNTPVQAESRDDLTKLLNVSSGGVVFTTIQKFNPETGNTYPELSNRRNIVVIADEAHRTQYGFKAKTVDVKNELGYTIGKKITYGFAKYMRDALPNATYLGFTGTPIESDDVNTPAVFGDYVDIYDIAQAVEDGATVKIYYESRLAKVQLTQKGKKLIGELDSELSTEELSHTQQAKAKWTQLEALIGSKDRVKHLAEDIITHFERRQTVFEGKGMIVTMSRRIGAELYEEIIKLRPSWHDTDITKGAIKVVMTSASSDGPELAKFNTTKKQRRNLAERMKDSEDSLKLVIVCDMWLTGFDVPSLHTLYIDKPMKGHNLMQAIARVNRVYKDKPAGLIVDYLGIASDLKKALSFYSESGGKGDPAIGQETAVQLLLEKIEVVSQMFHGFPYEEYFCADTSRKLSLILGAEEHILGLQEGKKRFIDEVTALSKAFAIAVPHEDALDVKDEMSFFQAVKSRLAKFETNGFGTTNEELETTIRQVIDKALITEKVIDVFDAAGIKKPDISILSEEFLLEVKNMEHQNIALEVLKKLLNDEIKARAKRNLVQSQSLMEMLESSIQRYHNKILTAAEVIEELIKLGKDIQNMDKEPEQIGLSIYEYAFYSAIASNQSAREVMEKDKLRELAVVLYEKVKENASIDWTIKENVKAKLKVVVKRTLRQYGYPPDMQKLATETVLKQAELLAKELTKD